LNGTWRTTADKSGRKGENRVFVMEDFKNVSDWKGDLTSSAEHVKVGKRTGKWVLSKNPTIVENNINTTHIPHNWDGFEALEFWCYSKKKLAGT
jgi:hypothetical protein